MKVLHTINSLQLGTGGPARSVPGLAGAAAKAGADIHLWSCDIPDEFSAPEGVTLHRGELPEIGFDLIHDHGVWLPSNHRVAKWASQKGIPRIVSPRGMLEPWALNHHKWKKKIAWWLFQKRDLKSATAFHGTADSEVAQFRKIGLKQPACTVPNGIDFSEFEGDFDQENTVVFLSRVHQKKGLLMWVQVWKDVAPEGWKMRIIGPDEEGHTEEVKRAVTAAGITSWTFEGSLEGREKLSALASAKLFALPTYSENFGIVIAEALAAGTPVITTTGTPWEGLIENQCGWWVEPTVKDLTTAFKDALQKTDLDEMGQRGAKWVKRDFGWEKIGQQIVSFYQEVFNGH